MTGPAYRTSGLGSGRRETERVFGAPSRPPRRVGVRQRACEGAPYAPSWTFIYYAARRRVNRESAFCQTSAAGSPWANGRGIGRPSDGGRGLLQTAVNRQAAGGHCHGRPYKNTSPRLLRSIIRVK
ncbi:unnamed protein product, partial [Iphiclides podalirius]